MERCAAWVGGGAVAMGAVRFSARKYQVPPEITMSATIPAISGKSAERGFGLGGFSGALGSATGFAWAGTPT